MFYRNDIDEHFSRATNAMEINLFYNSLTTRVEVINPEKHRETYFRIFGLTTREECELSQPDESDQSVLALALGGANV